MAQGHGRVAHVLWSPVRLFSTEEWGPKEKAFTFCLSTFLLNFNDVNGIFYMFKSIWVIWINNEIRCHCCYFHIYYIILYSHLLYYYYIFIIVNRIISWFFERNEWRGWTNTMERGIESSLFSSPSTAHPR